MAALTGKQLGFIAASAVALALGGKAMSSTARRDYYRRITDALAAGDRIGATSALAAATIAAQKGDAQAARAVGLAFQNGASVQQDMKEAARWLAKAAKLGDAEAQTHLDQMFRAGLLSSAEPTPPSTPEQRAREAFEEKRMVDLVTWYSNWKW